MQRSDIKKSDKKIAFFNYYNFLTKLAILKRYIYIYIYIRKLSKLCLEIEKSIAYIIFLVLNIKFKIYKKKTKFK